MKTNLIETKGLKKYFPIRGGLLKRQVGAVKAVNGVNFTAKKGECFSLVGESGCGKTTFGKTLIRLLEPTAGHIFFDVPKKVKRKIKKLKKSDPESKKLQKLLNRYDMARFDGKRLIEMRKKMQIVFQDPKGSLNPRMSIKDIIGEPLSVHGYEGDIEERTLELIEEVGLRKEHMDRYPHELSGGQQQRIAIARVLTVEPDLLILDEPTSALDVSVQAKILNLLKDLKKEFGLTYLFITHNISVSEYMSDKIGVMYLGKIVEKAPTRELLDNPLHPYTRFLLSTVPDPDPKVKTEWKILKGELPDPSDPPAGCAFSTRCPKATEECKQDYPPQREVGMDHTVACWKA